MLAGGHGGRDAVADPGRDAAQHARMRAALMRLPARPTTLARVWKTATASLVLGETEA